MGTFLNLLWESQCAKKCAIWNDSSGSEVTECCTQMKHGV